MNGSEKRADSSGLVRAAMRSMKKRQLRHEGAAEVTGTGTALGQYRLGLADGYGEAIGLLEEMTGVPSTDLAPVEPELGTTGAWVSALADDFIKDIARGEA